MSVAPLKMAHSPSLSETALEEAANVLGFVPLHELEVYAALPLRMTARQLQALHGFELYLMAPCLMRSSDGWAVSYNGRWLYSDGAG